MAGADFKHPNYWIIWAVLLVVTLLEVWAATWDLGSKKAMVLLLTGMAIVKAVLVAMYFMHLKYEWARGRIIYLLAVAPLILVVVFVYGLLPDIGNNPSWLPF